MSALFRRAAATSSSSVRAFSTSSPRSLAKMTIVGNLADTPEVHVSSSGREVIRYALASNSGPRDNRQTSWFRVTSFSEGPRKDFLLSLAKGSMLYIEGDVSISNYQDANGQPRQSLNIVQQRLEVLKRPYSSEAHGEAHGESS